jgi:hypothetical protein
MRTTRITALVAFGALTVALGGRADDAPPPTRADFKKAAENMKKIGLAFHNAHEQSGHLAHDIADKDGKPLLSWRVRILPYIEEAELFKAFKLDEPWDSENNKKLVGKLPKFYAPIRVKAKEGETFYERFVGPGTLVEPKKQFTFPGIADGTSNTALVFEAGDPVIWTKPADIPFDAKKKLPKLGGHFDGPCHVVMCDGSVIRLKKNPDEKELKKLIMPADGEVVDLDKLTK